MTIPLSPLAKPLELIGDIATSESPAIITRPGRFLDPDFTVRWARAHEDNGFDRVLVAPDSAGPDGFVPAAWTFHHTRRLGVLLVQRPGFVSPTLHAHQLATLDAFAGARAGADGPTPGRLALHIITNDDEHERRGDTVPTEADRYRRTDEYLTILTRELGGRPQVPIHLGGSSDEAVALAARHADVYALAGQPLADAAAHIRRVKAAAAAHGRNPGISVSFRVIVGRTDDEAWARARRIVDRAPSATLTAPGGVRGNSTTLVGSPETVARALLDHHDIGVTTFVIRGHHLAEDALGYARRIVPLVRQEIAYRHGVSGPAEVSVSVSA